MGSSAGHSWATPGGDQRLVAVTQGQPSAPVRRRTRRRGILPSWPCEFDSRHPLHSICPSGSCLLGPQSGLRNSLMRASGHAWATRSTQGDERSPDQVRRRPGSDDDDDYLLRLPIDGARRLRKAAGDWDSPTQPVQRRQWTTSSAGRRRARRSLAASSGYPNEIAPIGVKSSGTPKAARNDR
jgi:hypothetical protein